MADDEEATSQAMAQSRQQVRAAVAEHDGHLVNFVGDNFMAVFGRATDAVQAGIDITLARESGNVDVPADRQLRFRMGIDHGEVRITADDYTGDALNVAARIQALAPAGGLAVSGGVYGALDEPALRFRPVGSRRLKNIPEAVEVYEFADLPTHGREDAGQPISLGLPTLAVLPLHLDGVASETAARFQVLRADLIHRLSSIPELEVIDADHTEPTPATGARYILETHVYASGERVRVHATVIDVATMNIVKGHRESGTLDGILEVSDAPRSRELAGGDGAVAPCTGNCGVRLMGYGLRTPSSPLLGLDFAGTVAGLGRGVTRFSVGDEVLGVADGALAEPAVAREDKIVAKPSSLSFADAAALPVSGITALQVVIGMAVTRDGIPVRVWSWPGNTTDTALIRQVKADLRDWTLGKVVWVADRGFTSQATPGAT